jgi:hypothetical protein
MHRSDGLHLADAGRSVRRGCNEEKNTQDGLVTIRIGLGRVGSKPRDLKNDRGYRVVVVVMSMRLSLNPHPLKTEGAAPKCRFDYWGHWV